MTSPRSRISPPSRDQRGLALLSSLLAVTLLSIVVLEFAEVQMVHTHLGRNADNAVAAQLLARSAVVAGEALLIQDKKENSNRPTAPDGLWAMPITVPAGDGMVSLQISDEEGKLDLNRAGDPKVRPALQRLFEELDLDPGLLAEIEEWIAPAPAGGEAAAPTAADCVLPSCTARRGPLLSVDELRLLRGFDDRTIRRLRPYAGAWGERGNGQVNVNTADPLVLRAIGCEVGKDLVVPPGGFERVQDVTECSSKEAGQLLKTRSDVFSIAATGTVGDVTQGVTAVVKPDARRARRLSWRERPVSDLSPQEVP